MQVKRWLRLLKNGHIDVLGKEVAQYKARITPPEDVALIEISTLLENAVCTPDPELYCLAVRKVKRLLQEVETPISCGTNKKEVKNNAKSNR